MEKGITSKNKGYPTKVAAIMLDHRFANFNEDKFKKHIESRL